MAKKNKQKKNAGADDGEDAGGEEELPEDINTLTAAQLREALKARSLSIKGNKQELVMRLQDALSSEGDAMAVDSEEDPFLSAGDASNKADDQIETGDDSISTAKPRPKSAGLVVSIAKAISPKVVDNGETIETGLASAAAPEADDEVTLKGVELEEDDPKTDTVRIETTAKAKFLTQDTTLNVLPSTVGGMLMTMCENGLQHLLAGARANIGIKSGRYMFETKMVEQLDLNPGASAPRPKHLLSIGFSTAGVVPIIGDTEDSISFDSEGFMSFNKQKTRIFKDKIEPLQTFAILLNLDETSPNVGTVSVFRNGKRLCPPQPLPDQLRHLILFPTVTFRGVSVNVHFGPTPRSPLPFKCRMVQEAAADDVLETFYEEPLDSKYDLIFPICMPDEGTFEWLDWFQAQHPGRYTELSDRMISNWAQRSGLTHRTSASAPAASNDRPDMNFGVKELEDGSTKSLLTMIASVQKRNLIIMEVNGNLMQSERIDALTKFRLSHFKKVARCLVGKPEEEFKEVNYADVLRQRQEKLNEEWTARCEEKRRVRAEARAVAREQKRKRRQEEAAAAKRRKLEVEEAKKAEEAKNAEEANKSGETKTEDGAVKEEDEGKQKEQPDEAKTNESDGKDAAKTEDTEMKVEEDEKKTIGDEVKEEDAEVAKEEEEPAKETKPSDVMVVEEEAKEEETMEEELEDEAEEQPADEDMGEPAKAKLTPNEERRCCREKKGKVTDMTIVQLNANFTRFTLPSESEGFDEIQFPWDSKDNAIEYVQDWICEKKMYTRLDHIVAGQWFKNKRQEWKENLMKWHARQSESKDPSKKKQASLTAASAAGEETKAIKDGTDKSTEDGEKEKETDKEKDPVTELEAYLDKQDFDVFAIEDVSTVGANGDPLFTNFVFEDWALLGLRFELHLLTHAFRQDCNDKDRFGVPIDHLTFYYSKYFGKSLNTKDYGADSMDALLRLVKDTIIVNKKYRIIESQLPEELESNAIFVKLTEESRRDRQCLIDSGDTSAQLRFPVRQNAAGIAPAPLTAPPQAKTAQIKAAAIQAKAAQAAQGKAFAKSTGALAPGLQQANTSAWNVRPQIQQRGAWQGRPNLSVTSGGTQRFTPKMGNPGTMVGNLGAALGKAATAAALGKAATPTPRVLLQRPNLNQGSSWRGFRPAAAQPKGMW